mgnify:CR=1 FL=1
MDSNENLASDHASYSVSILCDEMRVKDGLVYDINTGSLVVNVSNWH